VRSGPSKAVHNGHVFHHEPHAGRRDSDRQRYARRMGPNRSSAGCVCQAPRDAEPGKVVPTDPGEDHARPSRGSSSARSPVTR
jgi:hypothetical protein